MKRKILSAAVGSWTFLAGHKALYAGLCAMCRRTLEMAGNKGLQTGFLWSVILIAGMPLMIGAGIAGLFYKNRRKKN